MNAARTASTNARRLAEQGRFDAALQRLDWELVIRPDDAELLLVRSRLLEWQGEVDRALEAVERGLAALDASAGRGRRAGAWLTKGSLHARRGERMTALECFRRARKLVPDSLSIERLVASVGGRGFDAPLRGEVHDLFEQYADRFDQFLVEELAYRGHTVLPAAVAEKAGAGAAWRVLDLGCGTGLCGDGLRPVSTWLGGVDLSERSVARARQRGVYDLVWVADLVYALATWPSNDLDVLVSADVLGYLGDLEPVLYEAQRVLASGGRLAFTVEAHDPGSRYQEDYTLGASRRFAYSASYLRRVLAAHGFAVELLRNDTLRREGERDVPAFVVIGRKDVKSGPRSQP